MYVPLSHADPHLSAPTFDVERFLLSRAYTSLPDLRTELRDYLAALKEELVRLINDDYEAFISLSTDLRGEGARLEGMKRPLAELKGRVLVRRACFGVCCVRANEVTVFSCCCGESCAGGRRRGGHCRSYRTRSRRSWIGERPSGRRRRSCTSCSRSPSP